VITFILWQDRYGTSSSAGIVVKIKKYCGKDYLSARIKKKERE